MTSFASLSSEELRESEGFYSVLRHMASSADSNGGLFDRTLFIKTNMQLGLDTMQNSLQSDWKLLTPEAKDTLIGSSMKPRPVSDAMLSVVQSSDNPSKCSCAQTAPKEYSADPSCCARGTELVFTWRKDGGLEVGYFLLSQRFENYSIAYTVLLSSHVSLDSIEWRPNGFISPTRHCSWDIFRIFTSRRSHVL